MNRLPLSYDPFGKPEEGPKLASHMTHIHINSKVNYYIYFEKYFHR